MAMRIVCPACEATYEVPDRLIGAGRGLRCKACRHEWRVEPPAPTAPEPQETGQSSREAARDALPEPSPLPDSRPLPPPPLPAVRPRAPQPIDPPLPGPEALVSRGGPALWAAWAASLLVVGAMVLSLWLFRGEIVEAWPPAARLFQLVGGAAEG
jgi:predicted Zn finger-like uncharacterized protein